MTLCSSHMYGQHGWLKVTLYYLPLHDDLLSIIYLYYFQSVNYLICPIAKSSFSPHTAELVVFVNDDSTYCQREPTVIERLFCCCRWPLVVCLETSSLDV